MSQRVSGYPRQSDDVYETPAWVTWAVSPYLHEYCHYLWALANGPSSKMMQTLRAAGFECVATNDDFVAQYSLPHPDVDGFCTNPPYSIAGRFACQFIAHALELVPVVAMLLRVDFDSGKSHTLLFRDCPTFDCKTTLLDWIVWFEGEGAAGASENHAWFVWNTRHHGPPTIGCARRQP